MDINAHLATAKVPGAQDTWAVLSSQPVWLQTFALYGRLMRQQYLALAKASLKDAKDYESLYTRYGDNSSSAQGLDQEVARAALQTGKAPRQVLQLLAQGPFTQQQILGLSDDEKKEALPQLLQYAQKTVDSLQQQRYLEYACSVTRKIQSYPDLYRDYVSSDLTAIQLDQKVTAAALGAGESGEAIAALHQGPYARFQQDVQGGWPRKRLSSMPEGRWLRYRRFRHSRWVRRKGALALAKN